MRRQRGAIVALTTRGCARASARRYGVTRVTESGGARRGTKRCGRVKHYEVQHKHVCGECGCRFPHARFLECHIQVITLPLDRSLLCFPLVFPFYASLSLPLVYDSLPTHAQSTHRTIHTQERHDAFFEVLREKLASFACVVDGCPILSWDASRRLKHLVAAHCFPLDWTLDDLTGSNLCDGTADTGTGNADDVVRLDLSALSLT
jgi:hypothetical protein